MAEESAITPIETVQDWLDHIEPLRLTMKLHEHARLWFRGHSDHKWKLHPGVYRDDFPTAGGTEEDRLLVERHLTQDFRAMSAGIRSPLTNDVDLYLLQQHYGTPTRLLDWTSDALGALSFSVADKRFWEVDGSVLMLDAYQFLWF